VIGDISTIKKVICTSTKPTCGKPIFFAYRNLF
jgi:hypothetical protein